MEIERLNAPYVIEKGEVDGQLVQLTIRAVEGGVLGYAELREATQQILERFRQAPSSTRDRQSHTVSANAAVGDRGLMRVFDGAAGEALDALEAVYREGHGRVSEQYLAQLAATYEALVPEGRGVSTAIADALDKPLPTIKGHIMRARREGYLSEAVQGREGGESTEKTRELMEKAEALAKTATVKSVEIRRNAT